MKLNQLADRPGARKRRARIGRGIGSGTGKTGGRGGKGQTARSGVRIKGFEGGQMPLHRRLPKRGFKNVAFARKLNEVNLERVQAAIDAGKLDAGSTVDVAALVKAGVLRRGPGRGGGAWGGRGEGGRGLFGLGGPPCGPGGGAEGGGRGTAPAAPSPGNRE